MGRIKIIYKEAAEMKNLDGFNLQTFKPATIYLASTFAM